MKIVSILVLCVTLMFGAVSCTDNMRARSFGGSETVLLAPGARLDNLTWKESHLWILTHNDPTTPPKTYTFREKSNFGMMEGTITIKEQ